MSQWGVQLVIGKLMTDEDFRQRLEERGRACLISLCEGCIDLNDAEIAALLEQRELARDSHHCPHGRPTSLLFTLAELGKQFRRS